MSVGFLCCHSIWKGSRPEKSDPANWVATIKGKSWDRFEANFIRAILEKNIRGEFSEKRGEDYYAEKGSVAIQTQIKWHVQSQIIAPSRFTTLVHCWTAAVQGGNDCWTELHCLSSNTLKVFGIVGWWWRPPPPRCAWRGRCQSSSAQWWRWDARHQDFQFFDFFHFCNYYNFFNYSCQPPYVSHPISKIVNVHHPYYSLLVIN